MTTSNGQAADVVEGLVESANDHGIRVGGEWRNVSKFHPVDLPERGARVSISLDAKGFIRTLQVLDQAPSASSSTLRMVAQHWRFDKDALIEAARQDAGA